MSSQKGNDKSSPVIGTLGELGGGERTHCRNPFVLVHIPRHQSHPSTEAIQLMTAKRSTATSFSLGLPSTAVTVVKKRSVSSQHDGRHLQLPTTRWTPPHFPIPSERKRHKERSRSSFQTRGHCRSSRAANSLTDWISSAVPFAWLKYAKFVSTTFRSALPASWRCATDAHSLLLRHCFRLRLAFVAFPTVSPSSSSRS